MCRKEHPDSGPWFGPRELRINSVWEEWEEELYNIEKFNGINRAEVGEEK